MSITIPPAKAMTSPTTAPHGIASHTFCEVLFCEIWSAIAEILVLSGSIPRGAALSLATLLARIFFLILSSLACRLKGFSRVGVGMHPFREFSLICVICALGGERMSARLISASLGVVLWAMVVVALR